MSLSGLYFRPGLYPTLVFLVLFPFLIFGGRIGRTGDISVILNLFYIMALIAILVAAIVLFQRWVWRRKHPGQKDGNIVIPIPGKDQAEEGIGVRSKPSSGSYFNRVEPKSGTSKRSAVDSTLEVAMVITEIICSPEITFALVIVTVLIFFPFVLIGWGLGWSKTLITFLLPVTMEQ